MRSQWECLLQNLGCWQGSFTRLSPQGELTEEIKSETILEGLHDRQTIRQTVRKYQGDHPQDLVLEYSTLNRSTLFFDNGAFSQGSTQLGFNSEFGAELGLIDQDRRLRLVQMFDKEGKLHNLTLIREHLPHSTTPERPTLTIDALLGKWEGEAVTLYADLRSPDIYPTTNHWQRTQDSDRFTVTYNIGNIGDADQTITSTAKLTDAILQFENSAVQTLFLPDGASSTCPVQLKLGQPVRLAVSWLLQPDLHQRMIRSYDAKGGWISLTLITEHKI